MTNQYANDFTRTTQTYFNDLKRYKPMTKAKEKRLLKKCKKGNLKAKNEILEANLRFVFDMAKRYTGRGISISELISEGNMGLIRAIDKFDIDRDVKFISYAVWWIREYMLDSIRKKNAITFVDIEPNTDNDKYIESKIMVDEEDDIQSNGLLFNETDDDKNEKLKEQRELISKLLNCLNERERDIVENYYGLNDKKELTLNEISLKYHLSIERVRQIKRNGLRKLRSNILIYGDLDDFLSD